MHCPQVKCKKSEISWLHEFSGWICVVLFDSKSPLKKCLYFDGLSRQKTIGQHFPMNCSKIGHSYLFGQDILICLLSAKEFSCRSSKISNHWKILIDPLFWDYSFFSKTCKKLVSRSRIYILAVSPLIHMSQISGFVPSMIMS